jgi:hypothetical protein
MLLTREWASSTIDFSIRSFGYDPLNCVIVWFCGSDTIIYVNDLRRWNRQSFTTTQTRVPLTQQCKEMKYWLLLLLNCKAKQPWRGNRQCEIVELTSASFGFLRQYKNLLRYRQRDSVKLWNWNPKGLYWGHSVLWYCPLVGSSPPHNCSWTWEDTTNIITSTVD